MQLIDTKYNFGDVLYLVTDKDQHERLVTGILLRPSGIQYELSCGACSSWCWEFEISPPLKM